DDAGRPRVQDPGRDQVQLEDFAAADDRVAGVVAALKAHDEIGLLGEQVGHLSLSFIAPLGADDHKTRHKKRSDYADSRRRSAAASGPGADGGGGGASSTRRSAPRSSNGSPQISVSRE